MQVNRNRHTFTVDFTSDLSGERYVGVFTVRKQTIGDTIKIGVLRAQYLAGFSVPEIRSLDTTKNYGSPEVAATQAKNTVDALTGYLAVVQSHCNVCLEQKPDWFNFDSLSEIDVIIHIYNKIYEFEETFFRRGEGDIGGRQAGGGTQHQGNAVVGQPTAVVDKQVQAAMDV